MNENNTFYCSFVSVDYIICDCGDNFATEDALKNHLEKNRYEHQLKIDQKEKNITVLYEYKCGTCEEIFDTAEECMQHQDLTHIDIITEQDVKDIVTEQDVKDIITKQEVKEEEEQKFIVPIIKQENEYDSYTTNDPPIRVQSIPLKVKPVNIIKVYQGREKVKPVNPVEVSHPVKDKDEVEVSHPVKVKDEIEDEEQDEQETTIANTFDEDLYRFIPRSEYLNQHYWRSVVPKAAVLKERQERKKKKPTPFNYHNSICEVCGKKYASNVALRYHQRVHTGDRPYACLYCPKTFTMPLFQQIHMRIHTGEKPYQCSACPKAFTNKAALLRHDRVHTGEKPYECPICGKSFSQSNSLKLHVRTVHLKLPAPYKSRRRKAAALGVSIQDITEEQVVVYSGDYEEDGIQYCVQISEAD